MIVEYIRYKIDPGRKEQFDDTYRRAGKLLDASPHCLRWEAARSVDGPEKQIVRIEWDSAEATCRASARAPISSRSSTPRDRSTRTSRR
jgi:heme-degrading monooxygenase HmoA